MSSIAVFDSGFGGLTVLKELQKLMPGEQYIYYGDSANAPYGEKSPEELLELTTAVCKKILAEDEIKCFVIACNTTTSEAFGPLTAKFPDRPFVGIEPALRWAVEENPGKHILVLGTTATVNGKRLKSRYEELKDRADISLFAATKIVPYVEGHDITREAFMEYLKDVLQPYRKDTDCVVLGCTHFPFIREELAECFDKEIRFYDAAVLVARETKELLQSKGLLEKCDENVSNVSKCPTTLFLNSDPGRIEREKELLDEYQ